MYYEVFNLKEINDKRPYLIAVKSSQFCNSRKNIAVSIDRITFVAPLSLDAWEQHYSDWLKLPFIRSKGAGLQVIDTTENKLNQIAFIEMPKHHTDKIRIDFNPNHSMQTLGGKWLIDTLKKLPNKHFSRLDIAIDIFNRPELCLYELNRFGMTKSIWLGRDRKLQTKYWGARSSLLQVRLYDKKAEQKDNGNVVNCKSWWRLEFQLRGKKTENYIQIINDMLNDFYIPDYRSPNLTESEQNKLLRMMIDDEYYGSKNKTAKRRLREIIKKSKRDDLLLKEIREVVNADLEDIDRDLDYYSACFKTTHQNG